MRSPLVSQGFPQESSTRGRVRRLAVVVQRHSRTATETHEVRSTGLWLLGGESGSAVREEGRLAEGQDPRGNGLP